jgi:hypothetical protein
MFKAARENARFLAILYYRANWHNQKALVARQQQPQN